ncbi:MAG TPA: Crp/Fnr family transcriptional regulator [Cyclobacteriaceae bacterium]|jgi:CRP-like cAMP-binding protein|nr:Crp/Fnr family transcriptional regulator [Cyclobacteriaceae bacterium]
MVEVKALLAHIQRFVALSNEEEKVLLEGVRYQKIKRKEHLLQEGQVCTDNYFVIRGCVRMYIQTPAGEDRIVQFGIDNWWITDYTSFDSKKPSSFNIQAVEDSEIVAIDKQTMDRLFNSIPSLERYFRVILQRAFTASVMRMHYIFDQSAEERYHHFNTSYPDFVQRVPQYMLASYLGFTPEFLSKIRGKKS